MTEQLKRIYEAMANKTLSFGCRTIVNCYEKKYEEWKWSHLSLKWNSNAICTNSVNRVLINWFNNVEIEDDFDYNSQSYSMMKYWDFVYQTKSIIGHPVMIGDVLEYNYNVSLMKDTQSIDEAKFFNEIWERWEKKICRLWKDKRKPIEDQSKECIDFVESLIPKE